MDIPLFISRWFRQPRKMGSIWPSSKTLARRIANLVDIGNAPLVVELGPGIGPLTDALLAQGVSAQNLYLIEKDVVLVDHLRERFPMAAILTGDARDIQNLLPHLKTRVDYVVSGLPLLAMPEAVREEIFTAAMGMMKEGGKFIQFSYGFKPPLIPPPGIRFALKGQVFRNLPPARVWVYQKA